MLNLNPNASDLNEVNLPLVTSSDSTIIPGFGSMTIESNRTNVTASLRNPLQNKCYFLITITLENGSEVFKSQLIPPGKRFNSITLSKPLAPGEYKVTLTYQTFDLGNQQELNGADLNLKIISK